MGGEVGVGLGSFPRSLPAGLWGFENVQIKANATMGCMRGGAQAPASARVLWRRSTARHSATATRPWIVERRSCEERDGGILEKCAKQSQRQSRRNGGPRRSSQSLKSAGQQWRPPGNRGIRATDGASKIVQNKANGDLGKIAKQQGLSGRSSVGRPPWLRSSGRHRRMPSLNQD
jgi:hypothetical protein